MGITPASARSNATHEVNINLFTLQLVEQVEDNVEEHHLVGDCGGRTTNSPSEERLPYVNQMDCRRMVVEAQIMADAAKIKQKGKSVEIEGQNEDDQAKQMDIWEDMACNLDHSYVPPLIGLAWFIKIMFSSRKIDLSSFCHWVYNHNFKCKRVKTYSSAESICHRMPKCSSPNALQLINRNLMPEFSTFNIQSLARNKSSIPKRKNLMK